MCLRPETISPYNCIFSSTVRISVFECSPVAHDLILPNVCARRAYPRRFMGRVGRTPLSHTLTWPQFQMPSRKGVKKPVCLGPTPPVQGECPYPLLKSPLMGKMMMV